MTNSTRTVHLPSVDDYSSALRHGVLDSEHMHRLLERERLRSDRSGSAFAVLTMEVTNDTVHQITETLCTRVRKTDVVGYASPDAIGVFLPDTPAKGAWKLVGDLLDLLPEELPRPDCNVFVYPEPKWLDVLHGSGHHTRHQNGELRGPAHSRNGQSGQARTNGTAAHGNGRVNGVTDNDPVTRSVGLRNQFAQPLPAWKRSLDILGALCGFAVLSPILVSAALAVKVSSHGPILFSQRRAGLGGRPFTIWKFRTMEVGAEAKQHEIMHLNEQDGAAFKVKEDPRVTTIGRILRTTSIDELPQLWNVLRGEMSLVGPRPLPLHEAANCLPWQQRRLDVTPGLTCTWQAHARSNVTFEEWMRMDLRYSERRTFWKDALLVLQTIPAVLKRRGAS